MVKPQCIIIILLILLSCQILFIQLFNFPFYFNLFFSKVQKQTYFFPWGEFGDAGCLLTYCKYSNSFLSLPYQLNKCKTGFNPSTMVPTYGAGGTRPVFYLSTLPYSQIPLKYLRSGRGDVGNFVNLFIKKFLLFCYKTGY